MHELVGPELLVWLESSEFAAAMRQWLWLYPIVEIVHITGIALLVGSIAMFDLRVLGISRSLPLDGLARHLLPWSLAGFVVIVLSGSMMFSAHATEFWSNPAFAAKMALIALAGLNVLWFHFGALRNVTRNNISGAAPAAARFAAGLSLVVWIGVICCGRLLAYL
jgi:hypothetical protein